MLVSELINTHKIAYISNVAGDWRIRFKVNPTLSAVVIFGEHEGCVPAKSLSYLDDYEQAVVLLTGPEYSTRLENMLIKSIDSLFEVLKK
jgi:hypothetical protein